MLNAMLTSEQENLTYEIKTAVQRMTTNLVCKHAGMGHKALQRAINVRTTALQQSVVPGVGGWKGRFKSLLLVPDLSGFKCCKKHKMTILVA